MWDVVLDCLTDTLKIMPFLFLLYVFIEVLEHKTRMGKPSRALSGKCAPLIGSAAGLVPMCGFSVMAAKLYERRYLTVGTLLSVFIATSDEAFFVIAVSSLSISEKIVTIALMCAIKFVLGIAAGYAADCIIGRHAARKAVVTTFPEDAPRSVHENGENGDHEEGACNGGDESGELQACEHKHEKKFQIYLVSPILHMLQIAAVILICNLIFGTLIYFIGEDNVVGFLQNTGFWFQPIVCCLVGMIPNCASSVVLAETFALGGISFGSCLGGLVTNAGLGILFLFKNKTQSKRNLAILGATFLIGVAAGYAVNLIALAF